MIRHGKTVRACSMLTLAAGAVLVASACSEAEPGGEGVETARAELYGFVDGTKWDTALPIPVCFRDAGFASRRAMIRDILEDTWARETRLRFSGFGTCASSNPAALPNTMAVKFWSKTSGFVGHPYGPSPARWTEIYLPDGSPSEGLPDGVKPRNFRNLVMHEFGHALGVSHDQARPDNWNGNQTIYCHDYDEHDPHELGGDPRGIFFTGADNDSIMSYCSQLPSSLSGRDVFGARKFYSFDTPDFDCQYLSDTYGIDANVTFAFAPPSVVQRWQTLGCATRPSSGDACQKASDLFGIAANETFGFAPQAVRTWWSSRGCATRPRSSLSICRRASETYGISAAERLSTDPPFTSPTVFNNAPAEVISWWQANQCDKKADNTEALRVGDSCQRLSDLYGISSSDNGWAPLEVLLWWHSHGCHEQPYTNQCQLLSDVFGVDANVTFGAAPNAARAWWTDHNCNTHPVSNNTCQRASDFYAIVAGQSWGFAPPEVQSWWTASNCQAKPTYKDMCQVMSDRYDMYGPFEVGAAPGAVVNWADEQNCPVTTPRGISRLSGN